MSLWTWIGAQLDDPTRAMHATGLSILVGEVLYHWLTGHPVDLGAIGAGTGCFTAAGVIDHYQEKVSEKLASFSDKSVA